MGFSYQNQRTLKSAVSCVGIGLHTGQQISMTIKPASENTGITFFRMDIEETSHQEVKAAYQHVSCTTLGTTIKNEHDVSVSTIEHLMAALWGCGVDNALIELNGPEVPIMDGSSEPFVFLIECAGIIEQSTPRRVIEILKPVTIEDDDATLTLSPSDHFSISMEIDFKDKVIAQQTYDFNTQGLFFKTDLSRARTFGFAHEVDKLHSLGLAQGGSLENAIVVDDDKVLNEEGLRYDDEFVRHKVLDCIGDIFLAGAYIKGRITGSRSGHGLNNKLLRTLFEDETAWRVMQPVVAERTIRPTTA